MQALLLPVGGRSQPAPAARSIPAGRLRARPCGGWKRRPDTSPSAVWFSMRTMRIKAPLTEVAVGLVGQLPEVVQGTRESQIRSERAVAREKPDWKPLGATTSCPMGRFSRPEGAASQRAIPPRLSISRHRTCPSPLPPPFQSHPRVPRAVAAAPPPWRPNTRPSPGPLPRRMPRIRPGRAFSRRPGANSPLPDSRPTIPRRPPGHTPRTANPRLPPSEPASVADDIHTTRPFSAAAAAGPASSGRSRERAGPRLDPRVRRQGSGACPSSRRADDGVRRRSVAGGPG